MAKQPEEKAFRLVKELSGIVLTHGESPGLWDITYGTLGFDGPGWVKVSSGSALWRGTIDLQGVTAGERTLFFASNLLQRPLPYATSLDPQLSGGLEIRDQIVVSDVPLERATSTTVPWSQTAGFNDTEDDFSQVKLGQGFIVASNANVPQSLPIIDSYSFGSGDPTATSKLYLYRWVEVTVGLAGPGEIVGIPALRYVATGLSTEEPDMIWMNRLRKSFENYQRA